MSAEPPPRLDSGPPATDDAQPAAWGNPRRVAVGVLIAVALVAAAWIVSEQAGLDAVGQGGINRQLLPKIGDVAPDFATENLFGNSVRLSQFRGQSVWLRSG